MTDTPAIGSASPEALRDLRAVVEEVETVLLRYPDRADNPWLKDYPHGSCSVTSYLVSQVLLSRTGEVWHLRWCFNSTATHTWLSRKDEVASVLTIDATVHQFESLASEPFVGLGESPVVAAYFAGQYIYDVAADAVPEWWHHGQTKEIYDWATGQLKIRPAT